MKEVYSIHVWNPGKNKEDVINKTIDDIVENPSGIHVHDIAVILLNHLRKKAGLKPFNGDFGETLKITKEQAEEMLGRKIVIIKTLEDME